MIVGATLGVAFCKPAADVAMGAGLGVSLCALVVIADCFEASSNVPVVSRIFRETISFRLEFRAGGNHIHKFGGEFWILALRFGQERGIQRELEDGGGFGLAGEFAIVDFVGPVAQTAGPGDFAENVGPPEPPPGGEAALRDDFDTAMHAGESFADGLLLVHGAQIREGKAGILKGLKIGGFVAETQLLNDFEVGGTPIWGGAQTVGDTQVERSEVAAGQMIAKIGGGQPNLVGLDSHIYLWLTF